MSARGAEAMPAAMLKQSLRNAIIHAGLQYISMGRPYNRRSAAFASLNRRSKMLTDVLIISVLSFATGVIVGAGLLARWICKHMGD